MASPADPFAGPGPGAPTVLLSSAIRATNKSSCHCPCSKVSCELLLAAREPEPGGKQKGGRGLGDHGWHCCKVVWTPSRLETPVELTPSLQASADAWPDWPVISGGGASGGGARAGPGPRVGPTAWVPGGHYHSSQLPGSWGRCLAWLLVITTFPLPLSNSGS